MNWEQIKNSVITFFQTTGLNILKAIGAVIIGILVIKLVVSIIRKVLKKTTMEKATQGFLCSVIKVVLDLCLIFIIAQMLNINTTGLLAVISTAGLAVSLALQSSLSNLANGIVLIASHPFKEGDYVSIGSIEGTVKSLEMTHTVLVSTDNKVLSIPNSSVVSSTITNYNALGKRKIIFNFAIDYSVDVEVAKKIINDVLYSNGKIKLEPAPFVALKTLDDSSLGIMANCWVDSEDYWDVFYYVTEKTFNEFKKQNINIPYNQLEVRLRNDTPGNPFDTSPLPVRVEKAKNEEEPTDPWQRLLKQNKKTYEERKKEREEKRKAKLAEREKSNKKIAASK